MIFEMNIAQELFLVLFSILYGVMLQSMTGFQPFPLSRLKKGHINRQGDNLSCKYNECCDSFVKQKQFTSFEKWLVSMWKKRSFISIIVLNIIPIVYFCIVLNRLNLVELSNNFTLKDIIHTCFIFWCALGVFFFYRIYHAIISAKWKTLFCDIAKDLENKRKISFDARSNLIWGIRLYFCIPFSYLIFISFPSNFYDLCPLLFLIFVVSFAVLESLVFEFAEKIYDYHSDTLRCKKKQKNIIFKSLILTLIGIIILSIYSNCYYQLQRTAFENHYLDIMHNLNNSETKKALRMKFDTNKNFTELCNWLNLELIFDESLVEPRYEDPFSILGFGRGRCGEFSILYVALCLAHGYQSRLVISVNIGNWTELHAWAEVKVSEQWIHVDPSDQVWNETSRYCTGNYGRIWGKYIGTSVRIFAFEDGKCEDVTTIYEKKD